MWTTEKVMVMFVTLTEFETSKVEVFIESFEDMNTDENRIIAHEKRGIHSD